jgi:Ca2+:H+ antiporter
MTTREPRGTGGWPESAKTVWVWLVPLAAISVLVTALATGAGALVLVLGAAGLVGAVIAAVHHAEVIAHRVGEPFGTRRV